MSMMGQDLADFLKRASSLEMGVPARLGDRQQAVANGRRRFNIRVDTRGHFVMTGISVEMDSTPYPQEAGAAGAGSGLFISEMTADTVIQRENGAWGWVRDRMVRDDPIVEVTPLGWGGSFGMKRFPVHQVLKAGSIMEIGLTETAGLTPNVSICAHGWYPQVDPCFASIGGIDYLEADDEDGLPVPVGRNFMVGAELVLAAGATGELVFNLDTDEPARLHSILVMMDRAPLFDGVALATLPILVQDIQVQIQGQKESYSIYNGLPVNVMTCFGGVGPVASIDMDRVLPLEPGSDIRVPLTNLAGAGHTINGCAMIFRR